MATTEMTVTIQPNDKGNPPGKLADAELHFTAGPLEGLKLIGFSVWERRGGTGRNVTFPARQYAVNGERRSFALLRPIVDNSAMTGSANSCSRHTRRRRNCGRCRALTNEQVAGAPSWGTCYPDTLADRVYTSRCQMATVFPSATLPVSAGRAPCR